MLKVEGALTEYQSFRVKGSWVLFLRPFLPFDKRLFLIVCEWAGRRIKVEYAHLPTAMIATYSISDDRQSYRKWRLELNEVPRVLSK